MGDMVNIQSFNPRLPKSNPNDILQCWWHVASHGVRGPNWLTRTNYTDEQRAVRQTASIVYCKVVVYWICESKEYRDSDRLGHRS